MLAAWWLWALPAAGQNVKAVSVSNGKSFTDHISLAQDSRDTDVMVKFIFDEPNNTLTVSVLSYRRLFVFREATRYHQAVCCHRLHPERLPYVADYEEGTRFTLSRALRKSIPCPHRKYVFNRWIAYEGLQPVPADYQMVNDYIEQVFDIQGKRTAVTVTLRDLFLLDSQAKNPSHYVLSLGRDLNTKYQITLQRNPCLGMDQEITAAQKACQEIQKAYQGFHKNFPDGKVTSQDALNTFQQTRESLLGRYGKKDEQLACPDLLAAVRQYNQYVDSIAALTCVLQLPEEISWDDGKPLDTKLLYTQTRQLDKAVARWLVSKDELEKKDLVDQCLDIVKDVTAMIRTHRVSTPEEQKAVQAYRQAEQYFQKTCKQ